MQDSADASTDPEFGLTESGPDVARQEFGVTDSVLDVARRECGVTESGLDVARRELGVTESRSCDSSLAVMVISPGLRWHRVTGKPQNVKPTVAHMAMLAYLGIVFPFERGRCACYRIGGVRLLQVADGARVLPGLP